MHVEHRRDHAAHAAIAPAPVPVRSSAVVSSVGTAYRRPAGLDEVPVPDEPAPRYLIANVGDDARIAALELSVRLRRAGVGAILSSGSRGLRGQMRQANALEIPFTLILGDDEIEKGEVVVRNMETSEQESKPLAEFIDEATNSHGGGA